MILGAVVVMTYFFAPFLANAATQITDQVPGEPIAKSEREEAEKPREPTTVPDVVVEQVESKHETDLVVDSEPTAPQIQTTLTEAEQTIVVTENTSASQAGNATTLEEIKNTQTDFQVELWTDRKDGQYHIGNDLVIYFKANKDSRVTLFDVGTSGKVHIIFPNEFQENNSIKAGQTYRIPAEDAKWTFKLQGPAGKNILKAIATIQDVQILAQTYTKKAGIFKEINNSEKQLAKDISIALKPVNSMQWTEVGTEIIIME